MDEIEFSEKIKKREFQFLYREKYLKTHHKELYDNIILYNESHYPNNDFSLKQKIYNFLNGIKEIPKCGNCDCNNHVNFNSSYNFRKDILVKHGYDVNKTESEIMAERKYLKIYDCGNKLFEYKKTNYGKF